MAELMNTTNGAKSKMRFYRIILSMEGKLDEVLRIEAEDAAQAMFLAGSKAQTDGGHGFSAREQIWDNGKLSAGGIAQSRAQSIVKTGEASGAYAAVVAFAEGMSAADAEIERECGAELREFAFHKRLFTAGKSRKAQAMREAMWNREVAAQKRIDMALDAIKAAEAQEWDKADPHMREAEPDQANKEWTAAQCLAKGNKLANIAGKRAKRISAGSPLPGFIEACNAVEQGGEQLAMF